jgi:hypothetical protein
MGVTRSSSYVTSHYGAIERVWGDGLGGWYAECPNERPPRRRVRGVDARIRARRRRRTGAHEDESEWCVRAHERARD